MKILSVDDSSVVRKIIRVAIKTMDSELIEASDAMEGLEILKQQSQNIDLVLLDWNMPQMSGYEFLKIVKSNDEYKDIPIMMVTTESENKNIVKAIQEGADNYLIKPFTTEDLIKKIMECIGDGTYE